MSDTSSHVPITLKQLSTYNDRANNLVAKVSWQKARVKNPSSGANSHLTMVSRLPSTESDELSLIIIGKTLAGDALLLTADVNTTLTAVRIRHHFRSGSSGETKPEHHPTGRSAKGGIPRKASDQSGNHRLRRRLLYRVVPFIVQRRQSQRIQSHKRRVA